MADENTNITAPPASTKEDTQVNKVVEQVKGIEEITGGKYKSADELAKAYKEAERKISEQGDEVKQGREFAETVKPILELIRDDPALFAAVDAKLRQGTQNQTSVSPNYSAPLEELKASSSDMVIARFEEKYGIDKLPEEERRTLRGKIGQEVINMTDKTIKEVDLRKLGMVLEKAYALAEKDKIIEKAKLEAQMEAKQNEEAGISSVRSSSKTEEVTTLTPEEARVATKMGLTREQYLEGKKKSGR